MEGQVGFESAGAREQAPPRERGGSRERAGERGGVEEVQPERPLRLQTPPQQTEGEHGGMAYSPQYGVGPQPGPVTVGITTSGMVVKPGSVYHVLVPVRPLNAEMDLEPLRRLAKSSNALGTILALTGVALLAVALIPGIGLTVNILAGVIIGAGVVTLLHGLLICGAPGTLASMLLGAVSAGFGVFMVLGTFSTASLPFIFAIWLCTKGLAVILLALMSAVVTSWPTLLASGAASLVFAGSLLTSKAATMDRLTTLAGLDLLLLGIAFWFISCIAFAGMHMTEIQDQGGEIYGRTPYEPLSSA